MGRKSGGAEGAAVRFLDVPGEWPGAQGFDPRPDRCLGPDGNPLDCQDPSGGLRLGYFAIVTVALRITWGGFSGRVPLPLSTPGVVTMRSRTS